MGTQIPQTPVKVFSSYFYENDAKIKQWNAFIKSSTEPKLTLKQAMNIIVNYINSLMG